MIDYDSDISVTRLDTGEIACIRYEQTDDYPRHADVLRYMAYDQAKDLADAIEKTLRKTIEQLCDEADTITHEEEGLLSKAFYTMHKARRALHETFDALWKWNMILTALGIEPERMEQLDKALKDLEESDKTSNQ